MKQDELKTYSRPATRFLGLRLEPFCASADQEGNNGQIDDLVDFDDVWY